MPAHQGPEHGESHMEVDSGPVPATMLAVSAENVSHNARDTMTESNHKEMLAHDEVSTVMADVPRPKRKRRLFTLEEKVSVAERRKRGACAPCRARKVKCKHNETSPLVTTETASSQSLDGPHEPLQKHFPLISSANLTTFDSSRQNTTITSRPNPDSVAPRTLIEEHAKGTQLQRDRTRNMNDQLRLHQSTHVSRSISQLQGTAGTAGKVLSTALPKTEVSRYTSVHVLMLRWEATNDLELVREMNELADVFKDYGFQVLTYVIPTERSHLSLNNEVSKFVEIGGDMSDALKIVYYSGSSMITDDRQSLLISQVDDRQIQRPSIVRWSGIQMTLDEARSDVLLLLDTSCWSPTASAAWDTGNSVTEVICASSFSGPPHIAPILSFTTCLIKELKFRNKYEPLPVGELHSLIFVRMQSSAKDEESRNNSRSHPPIHFVLRASPQLPRNIMLWRMVPNGADDHLPHHVASLQTRDAPQTVMRCMDEPYVYSPLQADEDFRILIVQPGNRADATQGRVKDDPVVCSLVPSSLFSTQAGPWKPLLKYRALSYFWGEDPPIYPITIIGAQPENGPPQFHNILTKTLWIRANLHAALVALRSPKVPVNLWVDALCINQLDIVEKSAQVSKMARILSEASNLSIWLGDGETETVNPDRTKQTFNFIREIASLERLDRLVAEPEFAEKWLSFIGLMRNRWFSRRWILQELALAKQATVHNGQQVIQWSDFADAVALFVAKRDEIEKMLMLHGEGSSRSKDQLTCLAEVPASILVEVTNNIFRKSADGVLQERLLSLETLVTSLLTFEVANARDTVYALLSIAHDTPYSVTETAAEAKRSLTLGYNAPIGDPRIMPDYKKSLAEVASDFVDYCVETSGSLDIICRHWAPVPKHTKKPSSTFNATPMMPTWASSIDKSAYSASYEALQGRRNGESFVGLPSKQNRTNYSASGNLKPSYKIKQHVRSASTTLNTSGSENTEHSNYIRESSENSIDQTEQSDPSIQISLTNICLFARGICLDTIGKVSPRVVHGMIMQEAFAMGGYDDRSELKKIPDDLWRTLVADRGPNGTNAPSWYCRALEHCLSHATPNGDLSTSALIESPLTPTTMISFLKRVQAVVWNRKFLLSKGGAAEVEEEQLFGLAPSDAQEGDLICILFGCSVPVILRQMKSEAECYYYLIGESFIYGMMDGEALDRGFPEVEFEIR
ncbi:hypothetical protein VTL71DRAFT_14078 [Oculimacula yallundae]|uniref:Heterokaryon incompatibility domain-containing protein n=1 Tax=Oculimacula yallundae TaxID=86028 RepID=A0ABR4CHF7_9HELO